VIAFVNKGKYLFCSLKIPSGLRPVVGEAVWIIH
jgi:hypothetical protein